MLKLVKLASFLVAILSLAGVVAIVVVGLKGDPVIEEILNLPGIVDAFRKKPAVTADNAGSAVSPLVSQAGLFGTRIDPPPPPAPPKPKTQPKPKPTVTKPPVKTTRPVLPMRPPEPTRVGKFSLAATVLYKDNPERSLAMVKTLSQGYMWKRQGESLAGLTFHEIKDGSVVLYQGDVRNTEIFVPPKPAGKSLLKSDEGANIARSAGPSSVDAGVGQAGPNDALAATEADRAIQTAGQPKDRSLSQNRADRAAVYSRSRSEGGQRSTVTRAIRSSKPKLVTEEPKTPKEQKKEIDNSIKAIGDIIALENPDVSPEEKAREKEMFESLLKILEAEKSKIDQPGGEKGEKTEEHPKK